MKPKVPDHSRDPEVFPRGDW